MALSSAVDWSSLLPELLNCIAECFLVTSDLDYYIDFRAVCRSWRSATKDPKSSPDPLFRPRHWVIVDRHLGLGSHKTYLWVNTATGRFVPKELPLLRRRYGALCTTPDGLLVLNDSSKSSPCTVGLHNAFTGYWVHFAVPLPGQIMESAALLSGSPPTLVLLCKDVYIDDNFVFRQSERKVYMAYPDSESYTTYEERYACPLIRLALRGIYTDDGELGSVAPFPVDVADKIFDLMSFYNAEPDESYDSHDGDTLKSYQRATLKFRYANCCYLVRSAGEILIIFKLKNGGMEVYRMDTHSYALKRVKDIGNRTIFLGSSFNCISVNPDKFPSLDANCIYYIKILDYSRGYICRYNPRSQQVERISRDMGHCSRPYTIIQHLSNYGLQ